MTEQTFATAVVWLSASVVGFAIAACAAALCAWLWKLASIFGRAMARRWRSRSPLSSQRYRLSPDPQSPAAAIFRSMADRREGIYHKGYTGRDRASVGVVR